VIDDDAQSRVAFCERSQRNQLRRQNERIERQFVIDHRACGNVVGLVVRPTVVGQVLQHGTQAFQQPVRSERCDLVGRVATRHVDPSDDPENEVVVLRQSQQVLRVSRRR
jgi:hypothetical protein